MNNYDQSSSGENIELTAHYSSDNFYFEDFENDSENTRLSFGRDDSLWLIGDADALYYKKSHLAKMSKKALWQLAYDYDLIGGVDASEYSKAELIQDLQGLSIKRHYEWLLTQYNWHELKHHFKHDYFVSRGYSQGDAVYVVSLDGDFKQSTKDYINHVFWDSPVYINITLDSAEYTDDDLLDDVWTYDIDAVKVKIAALNISDYAKNWLNDNLPDSLDYI